jgi:hypothetical protein
MLAMSDDQADERPATVARRRPPMNEQKSEGAQLFHRISLEYEAATRGLTGLSAGSAMHTFITARLERIGAYHEQLASLVGETRATQLVIELAEELPPEENPPG